jgi:Protein of unknown function (DUF1203)
MSESGETSRPHGCNMAHQQGVAMAHNFQVVGIDHEQLQNLFSLTDEQLNEYSAKRCYATESPGYPCRISLEDARVGEELLLLPYLHQPAASPYRASGPIFVRRDVLKCKFPIGKLPSYVTSRMMSVRAYDASHMIVAASVCEGSAAAAEIEEYFSREDVAYIHLHNAKRGCFSAQSSAHKHEWSQLRRRKVGSLVVVTDWRDKAAPADEFMRQAS